MVASKIRAEARENLTGKWGKSALLILSYFVIQFLIIFLLGFLQFIPVIGIIAIIAELVISFPIYYGFMASFIKFKRNEDVGYTDFLTIAFNNITNVWKVVGNIILKLLPAILGIIIGFILMGATSFYSFTSYIIGGSNFSSFGFGFIGLLGGFLLLFCYIYLILKTLSLALCFPILYDNPNMTGKEIVNESIQLMNGHRWNLFWLYLTFIGWIILSAFTFYIGFLFLAPYILFSFICFYETLLSNSNNVVIEDKEKNKSEENKEE